MKKITRSALLPYSAPQVYDLVNDVARYPEFLPWCGGAKVIEQTETEMVASVTIAKLGFSKSFTTRNQLVLNKSIHMQLLEGPFSHLEGLWSFKALNEEACKITFEVEFEVSHGLLNKALGPIFEQIASSFVDSFCQRAKQVYSLTN